MSFFFCYCRVFVRYCHYYYTRVERALRSGTAAKRSPGCGPRGGKPPPRGRIKSPRNPVARFTINNKYFYGDENAPSTLTPPLTARGVYKLLARVLSPGHAPPTVGFQLLSRAILSNLGAAADGGSHAVRNYYYFYRRSNPTAVPNKLSFIRPLAGLINPPPNPPSFFSASRLYNGFRRTLIIIQNTDIIFIFIPKRPRQIHRGGRPRIIVPLYLLSLVKHRGLCR